MPRLLPGMENILGVGYLFVFMLRAKNNPILEILFVGINLSVHKQKRINGSVNYHLLSICLGSPR